MFKVQEFTLDANLATDDTLELEGKVDRIRVADSGHRLFVGSTRYSSPEDFTLAVDVYDNAVLTWLNATTIALGTTVELALAFVDQISNSNNSGGTGGGGTSDASAANQALQLTQETAINTALGTKGDGAAADDTGNNGIIAMMKRGLQRWTLFIAALGTPSTGAWASGDGTILGILKTIAVGSSGTDTVNVSQDSGFLKIGATNYAIKYAPIAAASAADNVLVAAVSGKKIRVIAYNLMAAADVNAKFQSDATDLTGLKYLAARSGIAPSWNPNGWFETVAGQKLDLNLSAAVAVGGELVYIEV